MPFNFPSWDRFCLQRVPRDVSLAKLVEEIEKKDFIICWDKLCDFYLTKRENIPFNCPKVWLSDLTSRYGGIIGRCYKDIYLNSYFNYCTYQHLSSENPLIIYYSHFRFIYTFYTKIYYNIQIYKNANAPTSFNSQG